MNATFPQIFELNVTDRLQLVEELWDSIVDSPEKLPLLDWHKHELDRRKAAHAQSPTSGATWEEVERRIRGRHA